MTRSKINIRILYQFAVPLSTGHASNQSGFTAWLINIRVQNQVKVTIYSVVKDSRNHTSKWGNQLREPGPLTVTYNIKMFSFGWTIPVSKIENRNENLSNYKELVKKFKKEHKLSEDYYRERGNIRLYNPMFQCQNGISASLREQYPQIYGRLVNTILAVPITGKAVNPTGEQN
jgi:hypothetical protein